LTSQSPAGVLIADVFRLRKRSQPTFPDGPGPTHWITYSQRPKSLTRIKANFETWTVHFKIAPPPIRCRQRAWSARSNTSLRCLMRKQPNPRSPPRACC